MAGGDKQRQFIFDANTARLTELAHRAVNVLGCNPAETAVVAIHVDDPSWTALVDELMPGTNWDEYRDQGLMPVARGSVKWSTVEFVCAVCPDISPLLAREAAGGHLYALVMAEHGVSVYEVPFGGVEA